MDSYISTIGVDFVSSPEFYFCVIPFLVYIVIGQFCLLNHFKTNLWGLTLL